MVAAAVEALLAPRGADHPGSDGVQPRSTIRMVGSEVEIRYPGTPWTAFVESVVPRPYRAVVSGERVSRGNRTGPHSATNIDVTALNAAVAP